MNNQSIPIITIDGPSSSGKGSISRKLASELNWNILDSGALYRIVAFSAKLNEIPIKNESLVKNSISKLKIKFKLLDTFDQKIFLNDRDITSEIRTEICGQNASKIAKYKTVRDQLVGLQRGFLKKPGLIADGRDMGTVVFPASKLKIYLTADQKERAKRRYDELKQKGINVRFAAVLDDMKQRDNQDKERNVAPLKVSSDSVLIDSTNLSIDQVVSKILSLSKLRNII